MWDSLFILASHKVSLGGEFIFHIIKSNLRDFPHQTLGVKHQDPPDLFST